MGMKKLIVTLVVIFCTMISFNSVFAETPVWFEMIRPECRPSVKKIDRLEYFRKKYNVTHEDFALIVLGHPVTTKQLQRHLLGEARAKMPNAEEKELWKMVLVSRLANYVTMGFESPEIFKQTDEVIRNAKTFDDVCNFIIKLDAKQPIVPITSDPFGTKRKMIDRILEE
jgi:hypothetical protein